MPWRYPDWGQLSDPSEEPQAQTWEAGGKYHFHPAAAPEGGPSFPTCLRVAGPVSAVESGPEGLKPTGQASPARWEAPAVLLCGPQTGTYTQSDNP